MNTKFSPEQAKHHAAGLFAASMSRASGIAALVKRIEDAQPQDVKDARAKREKERQDRRNAALESVKRQLTPEFLSTLADVTRAMGTDIDGDPALVVAEVFDLAGAYVPDLKPIDYWAETKA